MLSHAAVVAPLISYIPSPSQGVWHLGPIPIRAYALCILLGIVVGIVVGERRWQARGGRAGGVADIGVWAIPFGIVGARLYHVITSPDAFFGPNGELVRIFYIWQGGLGVWGAVALGALGAWIGCRRNGFRFATWVDAVAPGVLLAQALGRFGNWFNQELFGKPTTLPWGLQIDPAHRPLGFEQYATFHPTFAYEALWCLAAAGVLIWADRRFGLRDGQVCFLYVALYCLGRVWIESLRIDEAEHILGLRLNIWTSLILMAIGLALFTWSRRRSASHHDDSSKVSEAG